MHHEEWEAYHRIKEQQIFSPLKIAYDRNHPSFTADNHFHFVLCDGVEIVSIAHIEVLNDSAIALRSLVTDTPYQRKGFGKEMMAWVEKWAQHQGVKKIKMHARLSAEAFYRKQGYTEILFDDAYIQKDSIDLGKKLLGC
jgi:GNAT superfamily N-acetyltransferase